MPNWAENILTISGAAERIEDLREKYASTDDFGRKVVIDFNKVIPVPEELAATTSPNRTNAQEMKEKHGYPDWYEFCCNKWGTKWPAGDFEIVDNYSDQFLSNLTLKFDTAWSPPAGIVKAMGEQFPDLSFDLLSCDPSMDWGYRLNVSQGQVTENDCTYGDIRSEFNHNWDEDDDESEVEV